MRKERILVCAQYLFQITSIADDVVSLMLIWPAFTQSMKNALSAVVKYVVIGGGGASDIVGSEQKQHMDCNVCPCSACDGPRCVWRAWKGNSQQLNRANRRKMHIVTVQMINDDFLNAVT